MSKSLQKAEIGSLAYLLAWGLLLAVPGSAYGEMFGSVTSPDEHEELYNINSSTGEGTKVSAAGLYPRDVQGMAYDPDNQILYGSDTSGFNNNQLVVIDPSTGTATAIGVLEESDGTPVNYVASLAYDRHNQILYGTSFGTDRLYSIDPATGTMTMIDTTGNGLGFSGINGLAYDETTGTLYGANIVVGATPASLVTIDTTTGEATAVSGSFGLNISIFGLAFEDGILYGSSNNSRKLYSIDRATGTATEVGANPIAVDGDGHALTVEGLAGILSDCEEGPVTVVGPTSYTGREIVRSETTITTSGTVVVESEANVTYVAGIGIGINNGFTVRSNSTFVGRLATVTCQTSSPSIPERKAAIQENPQRPVHAMAPAPLHLGYEELPVPLIELLAALDVQPADLGDIQTSAGGEEIVFSSPAALVSDDSNDQVDVYGYRTGEEGIRLLSRTWDGGIANGASDQPRIGRWGEYLVFRSTADNLTREPDTNGVADIYLLSLLDNSTERVSWSETGDQTDTPSAHPDLGGDELVVVYDREDGGGQRGVYEDNPKEGVTSRWDPGDCDAHHPALSADATLLAYICAESGDPDCIVHFIERDSGVHTTGDCPSDIEGEYRVYFDEAEDGLIFALPDFR